MEQTVNGLPVAILVILCGAALVVAAWLAMRFGKIIGLALLAFGGLVVLVLLALAAAGQSAANYETAKVATTAVEAVKVASVGQSITGVVVALGVGLLVGGMGLLTLGAVGVAGFFALRYNMAQPGGRRERLAGGRRERLPDAVQPGAVIYVDQGVDLAGVDLESWGW